MLIVGLTGGIGSGKSTVANMFANKGVTVVDADVIARKVTEAGQPALEQITTHFGQAILQTDGSLNRGKLREVIFEDASERQWLEALLHPIILTEMTKQCLAASSPYSIAVIPLLFETGPHDFLDRTLLVDCSEEMQILRASNRDKRSVLHIKEVIEAQMPRHKRQELANDIIMNDRDLAYLEAQVDSLHQLYLSISEQA